MRDYGSPLCSLSTQQLPLFLLVVKGLLTANAAIVGGRMPKHALHAPFTLAKIAPSLKSLGATSTSPGSPGLCHAFPCQLTPAPARPDANSLIEGREWHSLKGPISPMTWLREQYVQVKLQAATVSSSHLSLSVAVSNLFLLLLLLVNVIA